MWSRRWLGWVPRWMHWTKYGTQQPAVDPTRVPVTPHPLTTIVHTVLQNRVTPLQFAAQQGHFKTVQALLEAGARLNALDTVRARPSLRRVTVDAIRCPCNAPASLRTWAARRAVWPDSVAHGSRTS